MPEEPDSRLGAGDGSVELTPLQLIRWIDTSPDLGYLRDAADRVQGRYDSTAVIVSRAGNGLLASIICR